MTDDKFEKSEIEARQAGIRAAASMNPDVDYIFSNEIPSVFGNRWADLFEGVRGILIDEHKDNAPALISFAVRYFEYARCSGAALMAGWLSAGEVLDNDFVRSMCTPDGYADHEGWAETFFDKISETTQPAELLDKSPFTEFPSADFLLNAIALFFFFYAARLHSEGDHRAMDILFEASDAHRTGWFLHGWKEGVENEGISKFARLGANARHKENRDMKRDALEFYRKKEHEFRSKDAAAEYITRKIVPAGFRTVRNWLREPKK